MRYSRIRPELRPAFISSHRPPTAMAPSKVGSPSSLLQHGASRCAGSSAPRFTTRPSPWRGGGARRRNLDDRYGVAPFERALPAGDPFRGRPLGRRRGQYESYARVDVGAVGARQVASRSRVVEPLLMGACGCNTNSCRCSSPRACASTPNGFPSPGTRWFFRPTPEYQANPAESATQTEVKARIFLDADIARAFGFVPSLNTGFDYFQLDATSGSRSTLVPVFGAGIRRDVF